MSASAKTSKVGVVLPETTVERAKVVMPADDGEYVTRREYNEMVLSFRTELDTAKSHYADSLRNLEERLLAKLEGTKTSVTGGARGTISRGRRGTIAHQVSQIPRRSEHLEHFREKKLERISHDEAFSRCGGQEALDKQKKLALELEARTTDTAITEKLRELFPAHSDPSLAENFTTQLYASSIDDVFERAMAIQPGVEKFLEEFAVKSSGFAIIPAPKGRTRAQMKAKFKYTSGDANDKISWYRLNDIIRGTLVYPSIAEMYSACDQLLKYIESSDALELKEMNDRYLKPFKNGYRDLQLLVAYKGFVAEIQLNVEPMIHAKQTMGHSSFELIRAMQAAIKSGDANQCAKTLEWWSRVGLEEGEAAHEGEAAERGSEMVKEMLQSTSAKHLLIDAAERGHDAIVALLLRSGADGNIRDATTGDTALHYAVGGGHEACVRALLDLGKVDVNIRNDKGFTALTHGFVSHHSKPTESMARTLVMLSHACGLAHVLDSQKVVVAELKSRLLPSRLVVDHAQEGNVTKLQELLKDFADPNSERDNGESALVMAIKAKQLNTARELLQYGAKVSLLDRNSGLPRLAMLRRYIPRRNLREWLSVFKPSCSLGDFRAAGFRGYELARFFEASDDDLLEAGLSDGSIAATRFLLAKHRGVDCMEIGCDPTDCMIAGYPARELLGLCKRLHDARGCEGVKVMAEDKYGTVKEVKATGRALKIEYEDGTYNSDLKQDGWAYLVATPVCVFEWAPPETTSES